MVVTSRDGGWEQKSYGFSMILDTPTWDEIHHFEWSTKRALDRSCLPRARPPRLRPNAALLSLSNTLVRESKTLLGPRSSTAGPSRVYLGCKSLLWLTKNERRRPTCSVCRCPGRPAVEITRYVDADATTGEVKLPPESK